MKLKIHNLLILYCLALTLPNALWAQKGKTLLSFGIIADIQYADSEASGSRFYRNSTLKLEECLTDFAEKKADFVVNLGDVIDRKSSDLDLIAALITTSKLPFYQTTGNHDYAETSDNKTLYDRLFMPDGYYSFAAKGWRFVMMNTNDIASYSNPTPPMKAELEKMMNNIEQEKRTCGRPWNGGVGATQMEWLKTTLKQAEKRREKVIIFSHHPVFPEKEYVALNSPEILHTVAQFACVKAFISGHHHAGGMDRSHNIPFIIVEGMVETETTNAYMLVDITKNSLRIRGFGRASSYVIPL